MVRSDMTTSNSANSNTVPVRSQAIHHRHLIARSTHCACFFCFSFFSPRQITQWWDNGCTAVCPVCGIDAVIPEGEGPITLAQLRQLKHDAWDGRFND